MLLPETGNGVMVGMLIGSQIAEGNVVIGSLLHRSRTGYADAVPIEQQAGEQKRVIRRETTTVAALILRTNSRQIQFVHYVGHKPSQVIFGQPVLQRRCQKKGRIQIANSKTFVHQPIITALPSTVKYLAIIYLRQALGISPGDEWGRMGRNGTPRGGPH